ncbi:MAG: hypothetical protein WA766_11750 [Candidatus Acidiferrales bacterium]
MAPTILTTITQTNSTSYCDELGVLIGLTRLVGESSEDYIKRLKLATRIDTGQDYVGLLNEITLQLGLTSQLLISLASVTGNPLNVTSNLQGIVLTDTVTQATQTISIVTVDIDDAWTWALLSGVVAAINSGTVATAILLANDGPTIAIASQSNVLTVLAQPISGQNVSLGFDGIIIGSELFNVAVPTYTLDSDGTIIFSAPVPNGTTITYQRRVWPYSLIGGDVGLISLLDPSLSVVAQGPNGTMVYQVQEVVQAIMNVDQSYWGA